MIRSLVLGTILGGLAAFLWSSVSWEVIGWHQKTMRTFQNEDEVSAVIASHTTQSGAFLLPAGPSQQGMNPVQKKAAQLVLMEKMQKGPVMFAAIRRRGFGSFTRGLVTPALIQMASALLLTWLLLQTSGLSYARRVLFLAVAGLAASVIADLPNWNWWAFPGAYTLVNPHRLYNHLVSRRSGYRQSGKAANGLALGVAIGVRVREHVPSGALLGLSPNLPKSILALWKIPHV